MLCFTDILKLYVCIQNSLSANVRDSPFESSSLHQVCLVWVNCPIWFASYCIVVRVLPCAHDSDCSCDCKFSLSSKIKIKIA